MRRFVQRFPNHQQPMNGENVKPRKCCEMGSYGCQVPMPLNGRLQSVDYCIADIVAALNANNIPTLASCCGHNKITGSIALADGRTITLAGHVRPWEAKEKPAAPVCPECGGMGWVPSKTEADTDPCPRCEGGFSPLNACGEGPPRVGPNSP